MKVSPNNSLAIKTSDQPMGYELDAEVVRFVASQRQRFSDQRGRLEEAWNEAWALYIGSPEAVEELRYQMLKTVGDVEVDWRHKINVGKAFEAVETIHGYLMAATFPNRDWFDVIPLEPNNLDVAKLVQKYISQKLVESGFRGHYENFLRQLIITGNSVMALPWRQETQKWRKKVKVKKLQKPGELDLDGKQYEWVEVDEERLVENHPDFETLDMFDCYYDVAAKDPNQGAFIRRLFKSKAEIVAAMESGYYLSQPLSTIQRHQAYGINRERGQRKDHFMGVMETTQDWSMSDIVEVWEYWGDVHLEDITYKDMVVTVLGDNTLLRFETNPYWSGRPFIIGSYIPVMQTYGMGAIQPNAGLLHELNIVTNQRLDNLELSINQMWTLRADGLLQPSEVYTEPGKVFLVGDHTDLQPVPGATGDYPVTYQESSVLEQFIDKNFGTGPLIGGGQPRGGERVTAEEIQAVRDAGGNRLSNIHKHIEETALLPLLSKLLRLCQQFVDKDELVRIPGKKGGNYEYFHVGPDEINHNWKLIPIGADYVADRKKYIQARLDLVQTVSQVPQMANLINYEAILKDLVTHMGFDDPEAYINSGAPQVDPSAMQQDPNAMAPPMPQQSPEMDIAAQLHKMGGAPLQQAVMNDMNAGGVEKVLQDYMGVQPPDLSIG